MQKQTASRWVDAENEQGKAHRILKTGHRGDKHLISSIGLRMEANKLI